MRHWLRPTLKAILKFLLTHPVWDATLLFFCAKLDFPFLLTHPVWDATKHLQKLSGQMGFLLTHPVWDATKDYLTHALDGEISTHTSRVGCDRQPDRGIHQDSNFYSHIPCGMRRKTSDIRKYINSISTHTSRVGCDAYGDEVTTWNQDFYSHIPCGMRPLYIVYFNHIIPIYYRMDL